MLLTDPEIGSMRRPRPIVILLAAGVLSAFG